MFSEVLSQTEEYNTYTTICFLCICKSKQEQRDCTTLTKIQSKMKLIINAGNDNSILLFIRSSISGVPIFQKETPFYLMQTKEAVGGVIGGVNGQSALAIVAKRNNIPGAYCYFHANAICLHN